ncbi:YesL family protein [Demequina sp.]|uniref:YesL family protein n=1 Tax=Demequina sp. TaxID=2050685 RepID=UPI003D0A55DD
MARPEVRIDPTGRAFDGLNTFLLFIGLNIIYLVSCIPIFTIGAATTALFRVTIRFSDHESGNLIKDYFVHFGRNFGRATALGAATGLPVLLLVFAGAFWATSEQPAAIGPAIISFVAAVYFFAAFLYACALTAQFSEGFRQTLKNSLLLPAAEPAHTFGLLIIPAVLFSFAVLFPAFGFVVITIGFSVGAYGAAFLFRRVFSRYVP